MKKAILIFIVTLLFTGCLEEEWDDCNSTMWLTFRHNGTTEGFDATIENDVYVHVYKDGTFHHTVRVPYSDIQNGQEVGIKKMFTGQLSIAAWAVPKDGDSNTVPVTNATTNNDFSTATITHASITGSASPLYSPIGDLYLGKVQGEEYIMEDSKHFVDMENSVCQVEIIIRTLGLIEPHLNNGTPAIHTGGSSLGATLDFTPYGEEIQVREALSKNTDSNNEDYYSTSVFGIMPSYRGDSQFPDGKTVTITAFAGDTQLFTVDTGDISIPGKKITAVIRGGQAEIFIDGWSVKTTNVIF